jgi:hypothetical protein
MHLALVVRARRDLFQKLDPGLTERFGVGHDVRLGDFDEIFCIEKPADAHHMVDSPAPWLAQFTVQHGLLCGV